MYGRLVAALGTLLVLSACMQPIAGSPIAADDVAVETTPPPEPTTDEFPTEPPSTIPTTTSSTTRSSGPGTPLTIAKRKTITTPPACATLATVAQIGQLTGTTASPEPEDKGFCSYTLAKSGAPAGIALIALTPALDSQNTEATTFEGNTAHRLTTQATTCDLRIALTDDPTMTYRVLWVSVIRTTPTNPPEPICTTVEKLAKIVFDKLPNG